MKAVTILDEKKQKKKKKRKRNLLIIREREGAMYEIPPVFVI
jgi:hypothetical protein